LYYELFTIIFLAFSFTFSPTAAAAFGLLLAILWTNNIHHQRVKQLPQLAATCLAGKRANE